MQPAKTKIKTGLCEPTVPTNQMRSSNGAWWAGKVLRAKTQNFPCRWENHEWMTTPPARQITPEKFLLAARAVRNFSPLLSRTKNTIFVSFTAFSQRKLLLLKNSPKGLFLVSVAHMLFSWHQFRTCGKFLTFPQWNLLPRTTCYISSHSLMWGKGFLTFPQPIFNFLTFCTSGIGYNEFPHIFPHTRPSWKIKRKIPYIFPMCGISTNALFLTSIPHKRKIPHFSHIFLTLKFHSELSSLAGGKMDSMAPTSDGNTLLSRPPRLFTLTALQVRIKVA